MDEKIKAAAKLLKLHPDVLAAIYKHAKEINDQFKMMEVAPDDNIYAVKIIVQDKDENWYVSQDNPIDDKLWADAYSDDRDMDDEDWDDDDEDEDDGGSEVVVEPPKILV